jgi:multidrug efflux pump subunit AcrA (membrane-fusion protein)
MTIGERIEEKPLVKIAQINQLRVQVIVPVTYYGKIQSGDIATVLPDFPDAPEVTGEVSLVDKVIDAASNTFRVQLELANQDYSLPAGLRCKADFGLASPTESNNTESPANNTSSYSATPVKSANAK